MTDTASQPAPSRRRLIIIVAAAVVVVVALVVGVVAYGSHAASSTASSYDDDYAAWKAKDRQVLLDATAKLPAGTYLLQETASAKALAKQRKGCAAVAASQKKLTSAAGRLPTVGGSAFGGLSSAYGDAQDRSDRRERVVRAYVKAASGALAQIQRDCQWNIDYNAAATKRIKLYAKAQTYVLQPGGTEPNGVYCPSGNKRTCISSITKKKNAYADASRAAVKHYQATSLKLLASQECAATSLGSASCKAMATSYGDAARVRLATFKYVRTTRSASNNDRIGKEFDKISQAETRAERAVSKVVLAAKPELKKNKTAAKYPSWSDHTFLVLDKLLLRGLDAERAAVTKQL
jgi:hypothetical protein